MAVVCVTIGIGCLMGIIYATDAGLVFLDVVDFYVNFIMIFIGFSKSFAAGWMYRLEYQKEELGDIVLTLMQTTFASVTSASVLWFGFQGGTILSGFIAFVIIYGFGMRSIVMQIKANQWDVKATLYELYMGNIVHLTKELESSVGHIPRSWPFLLKHVIPQVLLVLFINLTFARNENGTEFSHYGGYATWPFQEIGMFAVLLVVTVFIVGVFMPETFKSLASTSEVNFSGEADTKDAHQQTPYIEMFIGDV